MSKAVFITGTGTDMGKIYLSGLIVKKLAQAGKNPAYYKAAMSGNDRRADGSLIPGDALFVKEMSGISQSLDDMCPYVYENAWSAVFITGTGTDMGKTYLSGLIVKKLAQAGKNPAYYKAAMSGNDRRADGSLIPGDALFVKEMSGISQSLDDMCPYVYENAWSPHLASRVEGNPVDLDVVRRGFLKAANDYEYITMEGSGGILCPLCFDERKIQLEDVIREFELSSILVADAGLGTINSVVLTAEYMKVHSLPIKGIIFNHYHPGNIMEEDNIAMCQYMTGLPVIAKVQDNAKDLDIDADVLAEFYDEVKIK